MSKKSLKNIINSKEARKYLERIENIEILQELYKVKKDKNNLNIIIKNIPFAIILKDNNSSILEVNDNFLNYYNIKREDIIGQNWRYEFKKELIEKIILEDKMVINKRDNIQFIREKIINGELRTIEVHKIPVWDNKNNVIGIVVIYMDIVNFEGYSDELRKLIFTDSLTGLNNRRSIYTYLKKIKKDTEYASLISIDIDDFKKVNDTFGHYWGDKVLVLISNIFKRVCNDAFVARISGDEFIIIYKDVTNEKFLIKKVKEIIKTLNYQFRKREKINSISASFGILTDKIKDNKIEDLLKKADFALYKAKIRGKNQYAFYTKEFEKERLFKLEIERELKRALKNNELELYYQPQYTYNKKIIGFEALLRWNNEKFKNVPVEKIISYIEQVNMINIFGKYILRKALLFSKEINKNREDPIIVSVNISEIQIMYENFTDIIENLLKEININPNLLGIEITENTLIKNIKFNIKKLKKLKKFGVKVYLDDFGKGYSSLNYLIKLPISGIKIDKEFIQNMSKSDDYKKLVKLAVDIGQSLEIQVVAEGVETYKQLHILKEMNVEYIQGYLFSKPLCEKDAKKLIHKLK